MTKTTMVCAAMACAMALEARDVSDLFSPSPDERPYGAVPSASQLSRDEMDIISIIHFGINTFTDQEWGFGGEDPAKFDPGDVDFDLMMRQAKDAGIDGIIFVAKHHDGFCLWPTKTTEYNITKSPYKGGKGDMVRDAIDAARRQGLRTAVYCSPWDRNTALYGKPEYIKMFREQVKELLTGYGEMFEMWFDGANGGDGWYGGAKEHRWIDRTTYYDWPTTWKMVHEIHPTACIESDVGPDVRWGGNEMGFGGPECWAAYDPKSFQPGKVAMPGDCQNVRDAFLGTRNGKTWMPAEFDVSLRPGWFYHPGEDGRAKDPEHLMDIYFSSTGNGGMMNIGLQPDRKGRIHPDDVKKLKTFGDELEKMLSNDFAKDAEARRTADGVELAFAREVEFNVVRLMEDCRYGQRIDDFAVDYFDGEWKPFAKGQAVGIRRLLRREETVKATKVRLRIVHCEMTPLLKDFSVMRCGLKRNAWFKDFEKRSFSKDRTIEGRQVKIDLDPNVGKGRYRIDADGEGFRISAFDEECAQAAIRELCAKLRGESAAEPRSRVLEDGGTGPYKAVMTEVPGFVEHTVFRPADMSPFNPGKPLPVLVWGNGACANSPIEHAKFLNEIASHGYLVLATGIFPETDEPYRGPMSRPEQQIESIDWAFAAQDGAAGDEYCGRIDVKKICIAGMSCGGLQALINCADPRVTAVMICNSGLFIDPSKAMKNVPMPTKEKLKELHSPVIYILGGEPDIAYGNGMDDFHRINHVPAIAANLPVGHGGTYGRPHGGEFAVVARIWLDWQLKGDAGAAKMFVGENCGLAKRPGWTIERNALATHLQEGRASKVPWQDESVSSIFDVKAGEAVRP